MLQFTAKVDPIKKKKKITGKVYCFVFPASSFSSFFSGRGELNRGDAADDDGRRRVVMYLGTTLKVDKITSQTHRSNAAA